MFRLFTKKKENFTCENCQTEVTGTGYTNHCPQCLFSKHVDIFPGDRLDDCGGLMEPVAVEKEGSKYVLTHKCTLCNYTKNNKVEDEDNFDEVVKVSKRLQDQRL